MNFQTSKQTQLPPLYFIVVSYLFLNSLINVLTDFLEYTRSNISFMKTERYVTFVECIFPWFRSWTSYVRFDGNYTVYSQFLHISLALVWTEVLWKIVNCFLEKDREVYSCCSLHHFVFVVLLDWLVSKARNPSLTRYLTRIKKNEFMPFSKIIV